MANQKKSFLLLASLFVALTAVFADSSTYLNFTAVNRQSTLKLENIGSPHSADIEYSTDGVNWNTYTIGNYITLEAGEKVYFKALSSNPLFSKGHTNNYYQFAMTGTIAADGNIMSLLDATMTSTSVPANAFYNLFYNCSSLVQAPELPATTLGDSCYFLMFRNCTSLTQAPALPATNLSKECYANMFEGCQSLTQAPALPAMNLGEKCYSCMFWRCQSLTQAPALPATTLSELCYYSMFAASGLEQAPALPATTLASNCYNSMFEGCMSLSKITTLPATVLVDGCYHEMFANCSSLVVNEQKPGTEWRIPAMVDTTSSLNGMFDGTKGSMDGTPLPNTPYYVIADSNYVVADTTAADVYFYCQAVYDTVPVTQYNLIMYKVGSTDTTNVLFCNDTSFVVNRLPRVIVIVDSVSGTTSTVTISINHSAYDVPNQDEVSVHMENLAENSTYSLTLLPMDSLDNVLDSNSCVLSTNLSSSVSEVTEEVDDFFPTDQTDVFTVDGRYIGKYYLDLPPGIYLMRDKGRWYKFGKVR